MTSDYNLKPYDYYHEHHHHCKPHPGPGLNAYPGAPWDKALAEHNLDEKAHPHLLKLIKDITCNYCSKESIAERDSIEEEDRKIGLMVYVQETDLVYRLENGTENSNWKELNLNSKQYIKLGRYNPPSNPDVGTLFFDLREERLKVYMGEWLSLPNRLDISHAIQEHNLDPEAHSEKFKDAENLWLAI